METNEISMHEATVYLVFSSHPDRWFSNKQITEMTNLHPKCVAAHTLRMLRNGVLERAEVYPGHRHKFLGTKNNPMYHQRVRKAAIVLGLATE